MDGINNDGAVKRAALVYHELGMNVLPIDRHKKPLLKWKHLTEARTRRETVAEWFDKNRDANVAVVLGPVSGKDGLGLACRDFDVAESYRRWQAENPALALTLPTVRTSRGFHVYFLCDQCDPKPFPDGELKGKGTLAVLPPSVHASGAAYVWTNPINSGIPQADSAVFARPFCSVETQDNTDDSDSTDSAESTGRPNDNSGTSADFLQNRRGWAPDSLEEAIEMSLPTGPGQRHDCIFLFCRALRAMPQYADADPADLWDEFSV